MASEFITISRNIMHDKNLTQTQKFIFAEITQLTSLEHGCIASNKHFAELIGIEKVTVSRAISELQNKGYINSIVEPGTRNHIRLLTLNKTIRPPIQNDKTPLTKRQETKGNRQSNRQSNIHPFSFSLKRKCAYDNLSDEYKEKLYGACMLVDGKEDRFEDFIITLRSNGYQYKSFPLAYMNWDKERAYKNFTTEPEPKLGKDWERVILGSGEVLAVNSKTYETKRGVVS